MQPPRFPEMGRIASVEFGGVPFYGLSLLQAVQLIESAGGEAHPLQVSFVNVHSLVTAEAHQDFKDTLRSGHLVLADGAPVVWLSRLVGRPLPERVAGPDVTAALCRRAIQTGRRVFFLGSSQKVLDGIRARLALDTPGLEAGFLSPPMRDSFSSEETRAMVRAVNDFGADYLFVGMTAPKQEIWINGALPYLRCRAVLGVGAAFEFLAGTRRRAPAWMRSSGLEWLHRFSQEPGRLWKRYLVSNSLFLILAAREMFVRRPGIRA